MPTLPSRSCEVCGKPTTDGWTCAAHKRDPKLDNRGRNRERAANDPIFKLYHTQTWRDFKNAHSAYGNVQCQRLVDGMRCTKVKAIHHHILSPRIRPDLFLAPANVVGVCRDHHSDVNEDDARLYVPTLWRAPNVGGNTPPAENAPIVPVEPIRKALEPQYHASGLTADQQEKARGVEEQQAQKKLRRSPTDLIALVRGSQK